MSKADRFVTRMAVFVALRNEQGEILLQQRANTGYLNGYWDFAASGHVEHGESIHQTAIRELLEEVGVSAREEDLRLTHVDQYLLEQNYVNWVFLLDKWQGKPKICEPHKCSDMRYFSLNDLPDKCVNTVRAAMASDLRGELSFSVTNHKRYEVLMHEPFDG